VSPGPRRVALATAELFPELAPDDRPLVLALAARGIMAEPAVWSAERVTWKTFDAVVIRSCWDYHVHLEAFHDWLGRLARDGIAVWNPPALVRWNSDKRYLLELAQRGIATIPTIGVPRGGAADVEAIVRAEGWRRFVLKPAVSASGYQTHALRVPLDDAARAVIERVTAAGGALVQPFADEVTANGEYSFVFLNGAFSHAAIKRPAPGEFRVQAEHGGSASPVDAPHGLVEQATHAMRALPPLSSMPPLYARVDGIARDDALLLMELELIEPTLYLEYGPGAVDRLAAAIAERLP
jgi:glutathione synthase/RimK-type ligase-like ATP-grasp enzyme